MSEAIGRRTFLTGLAGLALSACTNTFSQEPTAKSQPLAKPVPDAQLVAALKDFILARYEIDLAKHKDLPADKKALLKTEITAEMRTRLEDRLTANGIDKTAAGQLEKLDEAPALEEYFARFDLLFRFGVYNIFPGYELLRLSGPTQSKVTLFGKDHTVIARDILEDIIPHSSLHAAGYLTSTFVRGGQYNQPSKTIELRPQSMRTWSKTLSEGYLEEHKQVLENMAKEGFMDELITRLPRDKEFWHQLRKQMRSIAHKPMHDVNGTKDEFAQRVYERLSKDIFLHEAMHAADHDGDFSFLEKTRYKKDLTTIMRWNGEMRCFLASMAHGNATGTFGDVLMYLPFGTPGEPHMVAAVKLIDKMVDYVQRNRKNYPEIDFSRPGIHVLKQFPKISEENLKATAKDVYETTYRGRSLREFVHDFLPDSEKK